MLRRRSSGSIANSWRLQLEYPQPRTTMLLCSTRQHGPDIEEQCPHIGHQFLEPTPASIRRCGFWTPIQWASRHWHCKHSRRIIRLFLLWLQLWGKSHMRREKWLEYCTSAGKCWATGVCNSSSKGREERRSRVFLVNREGTTQCREIGARRGIWPLFTI